MIPPGTTTLDRMQITALEEQERIEISQDGRVREKMQSEPLPEQVRKRDDFAGIVRLIDIIKSDAIILERLDAYKKRTTKAAAAAPISTGDEEIEASAE